MQAIIGIGNPGTRYEYTRHNAGFLFMDYLAQRYKITFRPGKGEYYYASGMLRNSGYILVKPTTYVNLSGIAVMEVADKYRISPENILVVYDDLNLEAGRVRLRQSGGDGGHNGINSIISQLNSKDFPRLRIGIGSSFEKGDMASYVLSKFTPEELTNLETLFNALEPVAGSFITDGIKGMLDVYSRLGKDLK